MPGRRAMPARRRSRRAASAWVGRTRRPTRRGWRRRRAARPSAPCARHGGQKACTACAGRRYCRAHSTPDAERHEGVARAHGAHAHRAGGKAVAGTAGDDRRGESPSAVREGESWSAARCLPPASAASGSRLHVAGGERLGRPAPRAHVQPQRARGVASSPARARVFAAQAPAQVGLKQQHLGDAREDLRFQFLRTQHSFVR